TFGDSSRADSSRLYDPDVANRISVAVFAGLAGVLALLALVAVRRGLLRLIRGLADVGRYRPLTGLVVRRRTFSVSRGDQEEKLLQFVSRFVNRRAAAGAPGPGAPPRSGPR